MLSYKLPPPQYQLHSNNPSETSNLVINCKVVKANPTNSEAYSPLSNAGDSIENYSEAQTGQNTGPKHPNGTENTSFSSHKNARNNNLELSSSEEDDRTILKGSRKPQRKNYRSPKR